MSPLYDMAPRTQRASLIITRSIHPLKQDASKRDVPPAVGGGPDGQLAGQRDPDVRVAVVDPGEAHLAVADPRARVGQGGVHHLRELRVHVRRQAVLDLDGVGQRSGAGAHRGRGSRHDVPGAAARGREVGARRERAGGDRRRDVAVGVRIVRVRHCAPGRWCSRGRWRSSRNGWWSRDPVWTCWRCPDRMCPAAAAGAGGVDWPAVWMTTSTVRTASTPIDANRHRLRLLDRRVGPRGESGRGREPDPVADRPDPGRPLPGRRPTGSVVRAARRGRYRGHCRGRYRGRCRGHGAVRLRRCGGWSGHRDHRPEPPDVPAADRRSAHRSAIRFPGGRPAGRGRRGVRLGWWPPPPRSSRRARGTPELPSEPVAVRRGRRGASAWIEGESASSHSDEDDRDEEGGGVSGG